MKAIFDENSSPNCLQLFKMNQNLIIEKWVGLKKFSYGKTNLLVHSTKPYIEIVK